MNDIVKQLDELLDIMAGMGGSDLHIKNDSSPKSRVSGDMVSIKDEPLSVDFMEGILKHIEGEDGFIKFKESRNGLDTYYVSTSTQTRYRVNIFMHLNGYAAVFRVIPTKILTIDELGLPDIIHKIPKFKRGLILVTGATGSGKSTTLAAIINEINAHQKQHIITVEDPIEFIHQEKESVMEQRNIGEHTMSFAKALKDALREDPDTILIGEMRDIETAEIALHAANTGHVVFATLHTVDAKETINRVVGVFPPAEQNRIRLTLASVIQGIVSQRLVKKKGGGITAAIEVMLATERIRELIIEDRDNEIIDAIEEGHQIYGMQSFDQALLLLYKEDKITQEVAMSNATRAGDLKIQMDKADAISGKTPEKEESPFGLKKSIKPPKPKSEKGAKSAGLMPIKR